MKKTRLKRLGMILVIIVGCIGGAVLWIYQRSSNEREIRDLLEHRALAFRQKDLPLYLSCFSPDYQSGSRTYDQLKADATQWFKNFATIQFSFQIVESQFRDDMAVIENTYTFTVTDADGESLQFSNREMLEIRRESQEWKIFKSYDIQP